MTGMLASVTSVAEAKTVLKEGVDIIDLKNPHEGALGALHTALVSEIVASIQGAVLTSATIGDINADDVRLEEQIYCMAETGVDIVKIGLFDVKPTKHFIETIKKAANKNIRLVIVLFAENYIGYESFAPLLNTGIYGLMIDTKDKASKNLTAILNNEQLNDFIYIVKNHSLLTGLAGSLRYENIDDLLKLKPDYLGFRGALCSGNNRINSIDQFKIKKIRSVIPLEGIMAYDYEKHDEEVLKNGAMA